MYQLAKVHEANEDRQSEEETLELSIEEFNTLRGDPDADETMMKNLREWVIPRALLLLAEWAMNNRDISREHAMAMQVNEASKLAKGARYIMNICSRGGS